MMKRCLLMCCALIAAWSTHAQVLNFSNTVGGAIPDNGPFIYFNIVVNNPLLDTMSNSFGIETITFNISHTYDSDLEANLTAPDGTNIPLFINVGGAGHNFTNTRLDDTSSISINVANAPFNGIFHAAGNMYSFNNGHNGNGTWILAVRDDAAQDTGSVHNVNLKFSNTPNQTPPPFTSNLPIIKLYTDSNTVIGNSTLGSWMEVIDNGPGHTNTTLDTNYTLRTRIGISIRGFSSAGFPKKQYGFDTYDTNDVEIDTTWLGFPSGSKWILQGEYADKTLMRNNLSYDLSRAMGHYATRVRYVEVFINDQYSGVYIGMEKIERDSNRVNISKLKTTDTSGSQLTGGYIIKFDHLTGGGGWYSQVPVTNSGGTIFPFFQYYYPSDNNIQPQQEAYIQNFMDSFEAALNGPQYQDTAVGFRKYVKENTFIDYEILTEMCKDIDGYRLSTYFYKEKDTKGGKLNMGPAWDYDLAWDNANYCSADVDTGWNYDYNYVCTPEIPFWWERMMSDTTYTRRLYCRYNSLRTAGFLRFDSLFNYIDSTVALLNGPEQRNFNTWQELGVPTWPEPTPVPTTYAGEVANLKLWLTNRLAWLDSAIAPYATPYPSASAGNDTTICQGTTAVLDAGQQYQYQWSNGSTVRNITVALPGTYTVTVNTYYGCPSTASVVVNVTPLPSAAFLKDSTAHGTYTFNAQDTVATHYSWSFGDTATSIAIRPVHHYDTAGTYIVTLTVTDSTGCSSTSSDTVQIAAAGPPPSGISAITGADIRVYPNPSSTIVYIETPESGDILNITDALGQKVMTRTLTAHVNTINVNEIAPGVYTMVITGQQYVRTIKWTKN